MMIKHLGPHRSFSSAASSISLCILLAGFTPAAGDQGPLDEEGHLANTGASRKSKEDREIEELLKGRFVEKASVDLVMVPAVVADRKGRPVLNLGPEDFVLYEEGARQRIEYFARDLSQPVSIAFVLDVSGSMRMSGKIGTAKQAVRYFLNSLRPFDEAALIAFADRQVAVLTDFTRDRTETLKYLSAVKAYGQTALNDAIAGVPGMVNRQRQGRKAIVLLTDGVDNYSMLSLGKAMAAARSVDVPFYCIGFADESRELTENKKLQTDAENVLRQVSDETGGAFFLIHDSNDMKEAVGQIQEDLRNQYVLGYTPPSSSRNGKFRRIALVANNGRYNVRTRKGYVLAP